MADGMRPTPDHLEQWISEGQRLRSQGYRGRFAPTPSGPLHRGNLATALLSWLAARHENGTWLLRFDDLDTPRLRTGAIDSACADLHWLGLHWDGPPILQSQRRGLYNSVLSHWRRSGDLYPCRCSRRQLAAQPLYPGTCRNRRLDWGWQQARLPAWRLRVPKPFSERCGDLVLRRADGFIAYHLATAVDELALGISEVVRGADLAAVREAQEAVIAALTPLEPPRYRHGPLLCDASGAKLSKRDGSEGLTPLKAHSIQPDQVIGLLAADLGLIAPGSALSAKELLQEVNHDPTKLKARLNANSSQRLRDQGGGISPH